MPLSEVALKNNESWKKLEKIEEANFFFRENVDPTIDTTWSATQMLPFCGVW
jgi:hypothetical protein